jgi:hypothetical protein
VALHGPQQAEATVDVDAPVVQRDLGRLANSLTWSITTSANPWTFYLQSREVDDIGYVRVLGEDVVQLLFNSDVGIVQFWPNPSQQFNPTDGFAGGVGKVVNNDDLVSRLN